MLVWVLAAAMVVGSLTAALLVSRWPALGASEYGRKSLHVLGAFGAIFLATILPLKQVAVLMALMSLVITASRIARWSAQLYAGERRSYGDVLLPLGALVAALLSPNLSVFICAMLVVGIGDALASLVGRKFATRPVWPRFSAKTYLGSATFFVVATLCCAALLPIAWYSALLLALLLTSIEYSAPFGSDNLLLPLTIAAVVQYLL